MKLKAIALILCFVLVLGCFTGCGKKTSEEEQVTEVTEETSTETTTLAITTQTTTVVTTETTTVKTSAINSSPNTTAKSTGGSTGKVNSAVIAEASSGKKQPVSKATLNATKPKETTTPTGARIVATSAAVCDIMDRLGIGLVGVPQTSVTAIASRYNGVKTVGSPMSPDMEIIKSLNPTDVIGPDTLKGDLEIKYKNIGVNSTFLNLRSVKGLYDSVKLVGDKYGKSAEADAIVKEYNEFISNYKNKHSGKSPKVLVLTGLPGSYLVATQNSYAGSLVELAGGTNIFHDATKDFLTVNSEEMLARDPDIIIRTAHGVPKEALEMFDKEFSTNDIWKHFRAVQNGKVYDMDYMLFGMSATFDYPQALADLEPILYGD